MARCPECKTKIAPWRTLLPETKSRPLVCRNCGAVLRMKPGWLIRVGVPGSLSAQIVTHHVLTHSRGLGIATFILLAVVIPLWVYAQFAPAEKAEGASGLPGSAL